MSTAGNSGSKATTIIVLAFVAAFVTIVIMDEAGVDIPGKFNKALTEVYRLLTPEQTKKAFIEKEWQQYTYGDSTIFLQTPFQMTKADKKLEKRFPDNIKHLVKDFSFHTYKTNSKLEIAVTAIQYEPLIGSADLQGAVRGVINRLKSDKGTSNFDYSRTSVERDSIPGVLLNGTYDKSGMKMNFKMACYAKELHMWQFLFNYRKQDSIGKEIVERIFASIDLRTAEAN